MGEKFINRSKQKEWIDEQKIPKDLLFKNLKELDFLNRYTGGHYLNLRAIRKLLTSNNREFHMVDLGCGSGDTLKYIARWARKKNIRARFTGVDINPDAIDYMRRHCRDYPEITAIHEGYEAYLAKKQHVDIYFCSLFCHHLTDNELQHVIGELKRYSKLGFVIHDLIRSPFSYYSSVAFTSLARATPLAKNDGPVSVLRGFKISEIKQLLQKAGVSEFRIKTNMGFRFLLIAEANETVNG